MKDRKTSLLLVFCGMWLVGWTLLTTTVIKQSNPTEKNLIIDNYYGNIEQAETTTKKSMYKRID
jgi:hypothetical protein